MGNNKSKQPKEDFEEIAKITSFTVDEIKCWYKGFITDCPSGKLSLEEFKRIYKSYFPDGNSESFAEHVFRTFDKNFDGHIDFKEFITALSITSRGKIDEKLRWAFAMYDVDNNGTIAKSEMIEIVTSVYKMCGVISKPHETDLTPTERVEMIFEKMDTDCDGKLSLDEFIEGTKNDSSIISILQ